MTRKIIFTTLIFCIPLTFLKQKTPENLSLLRNKKIHNINIINKNKSQSIKNFSNSKKNIVEIKSCWEKGDLASQKRYCSSSLKTIEDF